MIHKITYSSREDFNSSLLNRILIGISNLNENTFICGIQTRHKKETVVEKLTAKIRRYSADLKDESADLKDFADDFPFLYATDVNNFYDDSGKLLLQIHNSLERFIKDVLGGYCPKTRKPQVENKTVQVVDRSILVGNNISLDLFGFEGYNPCVSELYREIDAFRSDLLKALNLCKEEVKKVETVRNDENMLTFVYENSFLLRKREKSDMINEYLSRNENLQIDQISKDFSRATNRTDAIRMWYHTANLNEFDDHVIYREVTNTKKATMSAEEEIVFGRDNYKGCKVAKLIISHLDELEPKGYGKKIDGKCIASLFKKCGGRVLNKFTDYFFRQYKGQYESVKYSAVDGALGNLNIKPKEDIYAARFDDLIEKYTIN